MKIVLAPRTAARVYALAESVKSIKDSEHGLLIIMAQVVYDSARSAVKIGKPKSWLNFFITTKRILRKFSAADLVRMYSDVMELEGGKKKVPETESQSDGPLPGA